MRLFAASLLLCVTFPFKAQLCDSLVKASGSMLGKMAAGDSAIYYQCHVEEVGMQLSTTSGQTLTTNAHKCSITEKFVLVKGASSYKARYYTSSFTDLPNRKFSGLKIREKPYWNFRKEREFTLTEYQLKLLLAIERKGHEAIEYDFVISRNNTNQLIIRHAKDFKQLVLDGDYVLSRLLVK